ncbi:MAG: hypothetical protein HUK09_01560 [Bacteroidaceae bacterium]|nr:hypothetical protein [Bacteroidaceae bacterium]
MNTHNLSQQESLQIITDMIQQSKRRYQLEDGTTFLIWGYTSVAVGLLAWALLVWTSSPWFNLIWFAIPVLGTILMRVLLSKPEAPYARSYVDNILSNVWRFAGLLAGAMSIVCAIFHYLGHPQVWSTMLIYGLVVIGIGHVVSGIVIRERSLVVGGTICTLVGIVVLSILIAGLPLRAHLLFPLYCLAFVATAIVPGHIIRAKAQQQNAQNLSAPC